MRQHLFSRYACVVLSLLLSATIGCAGNRTRMDMPVIDCSTVANPDRLPDGRPLLQVYDSLYSVVSLSGQAIPVKIDPLVPWTSAPELANRAEVARLLKSLYPPALRDAGLGGTTMVAFLVDIHGVVREIRVARGSTHRELDQATVEVVRAMRFRSARNRDCAVPFFVQIPITWKIES